MAIQWISLPYTISKKLFWWEIDIVISSSGENMETQVDEIYSYGLALQKVFNFYDPTSELSRLNSDRTATVSPELQELIALCIRMSKLTKWAYDITLWKYILERKNKKTVSPQLCSYKDVQISWNTITLLHPDVQIDLGSIAKWYITDYMVDMCEKRWLSGLIDARWDIRAFGSYAEKLWIQDPRKSEKEVWEFVLQNSSVATSGDYHQYDTDYSTSHILHQWKYASITVVTSRLTQADMLATALFVSDTEILHQIIEIYPDAAILCVTYDGHIEIYHDTKKLFTVLLPSHDEK